MGVAIDSVGFFATNPGAAPAAGNVTISPGDTNRVRMFSNPAMGYLELLIRQGATEGFVGVQSPAFHDNVRGIRFITTETPARFAVPPEVDQPLASGDTLTITLSGGAAEADVGMLVAYYTDLGGIGARLKNWDDIKDSIEHVKILEVDFSTNAAAGSWQDTLLTATEDLLAADRQYAVLGYLTDVGICGIGIKGQETGNMRICGPGTTETDDTSDFFVQMSIKNRRPWIPVISANNKGSTFVSAIATQVATAVKAGLVVGRLVPGWSG